MNLSRAIAGERASRIGGAEDAEMCEFATTATFIADGLDHTSFAANALGVANVAATCIRKMKSAHVRHERTTNSKNSRDYIV